ncbi:hypothetical protein ACFVZQ_15980, partial [Streptomyces sp. NPDC059538]
MTTPEYASEEPSGALRDPLLPDPLLPDPLPGPLPGPLVGVDWLAGRLGAPGLVVLDASVGAHRGAGGPRPPPPPPGAGGGGAGPPPPAPHTQDGGAAVNA